MNTYKVTVEEHLRYRVTVEAGTAEDATYKAIALVVDDPDAFFAGVTYREAIDVRHAPRPERGRGDRP